MARCEQTPGCARSLGKGAKAKRILLVLLLAACTSKARAQCSASTPNYRLQVPTVGQLNWGECLIFDFAQIDRILNTLTPSSLNNIIFVDGFKHTTVQSAVNALGSCTQDSVTFMHCGTVYIPSSLTITGGNEVTIGPWVQLRFLPNVTVTYTGPGKAFQCIDAPTTYSGGGGIYDLHLIGTSAGSAGIDNNECTSFHLEHVEVQGFTAGAGILSENTERWTEQATWIDVRASNNLKNFDFQDNCPGNAGCSSFSYSYWFHVISTPNASGDGFAFENDSTLTGDVDAHCFLLQSSICFHLKNTSVVYSIRGSISAELSGGAISATGIKTDSGAQLYPSLLGESYVGSAIIDLLAPGTIGGTSTVTSLMIGGGARQNLATKSSAYTLTASDSWVNVTGTTTITVPHALTGQRWVVFNSASSVVTIQADSGNINGAASLTLSSNTGKEVTCDGTNCFAH